MNIPQALSQHLAETMLPFWKQLQDPIHGGYVGYVGYDLQPNSNAPKGCIMNSRILWFFSTAYTVYKEPELLSCASQAYQYMKHFRDTQNDGLYWMCKATGEPLDTTKHTYNHAFAIYALSAYYQASGDEQALQRALQLFLLIEERMTDNGAYQEAFTDTFQPLSNEKLCDHPLMVARGIYAERTMNTLLHVVEAYTLLYTVSHDVYVGERLQAALDICFQQVYDASANRLGCFFDRDMKPLLDMQSYGHDIEASWLLDLAVDAVYSGEQKAKAKECTTMLAEGVLQRALQPDGSLINEIVEGKEDPTRIWWVQTETMIGMANLWQKTNDPQLLVQIEKLWKTIQQTLLDTRKGGEWFAAADASGAPIPLPIAEPWKAPYHNGRMCLEIMKRL